MNIAFDKKWAIHFRWAIALFLIVSFVRPLKSFGFFNEYIQAGPEKVVVTGEGITEEDAVKDAEVQALKMVVGTLIHQNTVVKNDKIIKEEIYDHTNGFVKSKRISKEVIKGIYRIRLECEVRKKEITSVLESKKIPVVPLNGPSISRELASRSQNRKKAALFIDQSIKEWINVIEAAINKPVNEIKLDDKGNFVLPVRIYINKDRSKKWFEKWDPIFKEIASKSDDELVSFRLDGSYPDSGIPRITGDYGKLRNGAFKASQQGKFAISTCQILNADQKTSKIRLSYYEIDADSNDLFNIRYQNLGQFFDREKLPCPRLRLKLKNKDDIIVYQDETNLDEMLGNDGFLNRPLPNNRPFGFDFYESNSCLDFPAYLGNNGNGGTVQSFSGAIFYLFKVNLKEEDWQNVAKCDLSLEWRLPK